MQDTCQSIIERRPLRPGFGFDDVGEVVPIAEPAHDEFAEVLDIVRQWALADRLQLAESLGLPIGCDSQSLEAAFERGREAGRAAGQRELLQRLFLNASTGSQIIERAAVAAFAEIWPTDAPCPLKPSDLASLIGVSVRTAKRRAAEARLSPPSADE